MRKKRAVILTAQNFQDEEFIYPFYRLQEEGIDVGVATPEGKTVMGKYGIPAHADGDVMNLKANDYGAPQCVLIPGGFEAPERLLLIPEVRFFVHDMYLSGKIVAAICHGPRVCIAAGMVKGKSMTGWYALRWDIENAGAKYLDRPVVVDGNLITSPHYRNNPEFMREVIKAINDL